MVKSTKSLLLACHNLATSIFGLFRILSKFENTLLINPISLYLQVNKQNEQMYTLLAMCLVLHPMRIDESVHSQLREKYGDRMLRMQKG